MRRVFVDADAFVALASTKDSNHQQAIACLDKLANKPVVFVTSGYVFSEVVTVLSLRVSKTAAVKFIDTLQDPTNQYTILRVDEDIEKAAMAIFKAQASKNVSFVDCTNIALVRAHQLDAIFSFDKIYRKNGLTVVTA